MTDHRHYTQIKTDLDKARVEEEAAAAKVRRLLAEMQALHKAVGESIAA